MTSSYPPATGAFNQPAIRRWLAETGTLRAVAQLALRSSANMCATSIGGFQGQLSSKPLAAETCVLQVAQLRAHGDTRASHEMQHEATAATHTFFVHSQAQREEL
eukprot:1655153-Amphidinium_carterae.1